MALISKNIEKIKDITTKLNNENRQNNTILEKIYNDLINDINYQEFVNGTEFGNQINLKIAKMLEVSENLCKENLIEIVNGYSKYIDNQENINNIEETI